MKQCKFRNLNVKLPVEPITDERPWSISGWVFAIGFILFSVYAYLDFKGIL